MNSLHVAVALMGYFSIFFQAESLRFSGGGDCNLNGLSYGGRLLIPNQVGMDHGWDRRKVFIFRTTKQGRDGFGTLGGGRGRIWVKTSQTCDGPTGTSQNCPVKEDIPCMDSSVPCSIDFGPPPAPGYINSRPLVMSDASPGGVIVTRPAWNETEDFGQGPVRMWVCETRDRYGVVRTSSNAREEHSHTINLPPGTPVDVRIALRNTEGDLGPFTEWQTFRSLCGALHEAQINLTDSSRYTGKAKVTARWRYQNRSGDCAVRDQTIRFKQLDKDNCIIENDDDFKNLTRGLGIIDRKSSLKGLNLNSLFEVTVTVITVSDEAYTISGRIRTLSTAPSGTPVIADPRERRKMGGSRWVFAWSALKCGERNSDAISYEYVLESNGQTHETNTTEALKIRSDTLPRGPYTFKVRAVSEYGHGDFSVKAGTI